MKINEDKAVANLAEKLALECGFHPSAAKKVRAAAALHDIGKAGIPSCILDKPGLLTCDEFQIMKTHTVIGARMLHNIRGELGEMARASAELHHEHYSGDGYWGKRTCDLPRYIPIISLSDVCVALLSPRPYKPAWSFAEMLSYIKNKAGSQFSPWLVDAFLKLTHSKSIPELFIGREVV